MGFYIIEPLTGHLVTAAVNKAAETAAPESTEGRGVNSVLSAQQLTKTTLVEAFSPRGHSLMFHEKPVRFVSLLNPDSASFS